MTVQIAPTTTADLPDLLTLWNNGAVMCYVGFPDGLGETTESIGGWFDWLQEKRATGLVEHFTIRDGHTYCGEAYFSIDMEHDALGTLDIKLTPGARAKGIGTAGLSKAIDEAFARGAARVYVDPNPANDKALALYDRLGFQRVDPPPHIAVDWSDVDFAPVYMELTPEVWARVRPATPRYRVPTAEASAPTASRSTRGTQCTPTPRASQATLPKHNAIKD